MLPSIKHYFKQFEKLIVNCTPEDRECYLRTGTDFLMQCKPEIVYWGRYINESNQAQIASLFISKNLKSTLAASY